MEAVEGWNPRPGCAELDTDIMDGFLDDVK